MNGCRKVGQCWGRTFALSGGEIGHLQGDVVELLPDGLIFLADGCRLLRYLNQLRGNGVKPFDQRGQEGDSRGLRRDSGGQHLGAEVREISGVEAKGTPGLAQVFHHEG